jgi:hypothetical protein
VGSEGLEIPTLRTGDSPEGDRRFDPAVVECGVWLPAGRSRDIGGGTERGVKVATLPRGSAGLQRPVVTLPAG